MWPNPQFPADLVTFTEEILNEKLHFLCSDPSSDLIIFKIWRVVDFKQELTLSNERTYQDMSIKHNFMGRVNPISPNLFFQVDIKKLFTLLFREHTTAWSSLCEKCPYSKLFWSAFFRILIRITPNKDTFYTVHNI